MKRTFTNIHGRQFTRGARPWLLIPKILCVACYFGGLAGMLALLATAQDRPGATATHALRLLNLVVTPAYIGAVVFGIVLAAQHGRLMWRMRWLQVKVIIALAVLAAPHFVLREALGGAQAIARDAEPAAMQHHLSTAAWSTTAAIVLAGAVIWLGRHKPRLGQSIAAVHRRPNKAPRQPTA